MPTQGIPGLTLSATLRPFVIGDGKPPDLVSAQSDKATGYVACATHRLGQLRSPDLPPDDNLVFSDIVRGQSPLKRGRAVSPIPRHSRPPARYPIADDR